MTLDVRRSWGRFRTIRGSNVPRDPVERRSGPPMLSDQRLRRGAIFARPGPAVRLQMRLVAEMVGQLV